MIVYFQKSVWCYSPLKETFPMVYILYNTFAGLHYGKDRLESKMAELFPGEEAFYADVKTVDNKQVFVDAITNEDKLVIVGGDGTLNHFVNEVEDRDYSFPIYCYAAGTGNDFVNDVAGVHNDVPVLINKYIRRLPVIEVKGETYKFINGIGYGIDGWCCEVGNKNRDKTGKTPNYTAIALKGLLYAFKTVNAKITVDGVTREYKNCWMAPSMNGRYFGGGMMITPSQDRLNEARDLSVVAVHSKSRLKLLTVFPKIFKGGHVSHTDIFEVFTGKDVKVEFDRPVALQIDGETILGVTEYTAKSHSLIKEEVTV